MKRRRFLLKPHRDFDDLVFTVVFAMIVAATVFACTRSAPAQSTLDIRAVEINRLPDARCFAIMVNGTPLSGNCIHDK